MSEPENVVARWSRLKREAEAEGAKARESDKPVGPKQADEAAAPRSGDRAATQSAPAAELSSPAFDPATLPPLDTITAASDIRAFLQAGVPAELTKAALRRAWSADPAIRDFIGLAENQWDFTNPASIYGFGTLEGSAEQLGQLLSQAVGDLQDDPAPSIAGEPLPGQPPAPASVASGSPQVPGMPDGTPEKVGSRGPLGEEQCGVDVAAQHDDVPVERQVAANRRGHGRALPQ